MDISMDMDMDGKFHIHGKPGKNVENQLIFVKDMDNYKVGRFLRHSVHLTRTFTRSSWLDELARQAAIC